MGSVPALPYKRSRFGRASPIPQWVPSPRMNGEPLRCATHSKGPNHGFGNATVASFAFNPYDMIRSVHSEKIPTRSILAEKMFRSTKTKARRQNTKSTCHAHVTLAIHR